jgi:outer membrane protein OmpA-like peptidoglycan-associated protein
VIAKKKTVSATTYFASGSSVLSTDSKKKLLNSFGKILPKVTSGMVVGYVQSDGNHGNDQKLSTARAKSVAKYLTSMGIKVQLKIIGKGVLNSSKESRRVTVTLNYSE